MVAVTNSREIVVDERCVTVRELTVGDVRNWLKDTGADTPGDTVGVLMLEEISLADLARMTSLSVEDMNSWRPSQLREVVAVAREMNADFFGLRGRLIKFSTAMRSET
jgi:hypothetical protein